MTTSIILFVALMVVIYIIMIFDTMPNNNKCTGDCNQGRNCTCKDQ